MAPDQAFPPPAHSSSTLIIGTSCQTLHHLPSRQASQTELAGKVGRRGPMAPDQALPPPVHPSPTLITDAHFQPLRRPPAGRPDKQSRRERWGGAARWHRIRRFRRPPRHPLSPSEPPFIRYAASPAQTRTFVIGACFQPLRSPPKHPPSSSMPPFMASCLVRSEQAPHDFWAGPSPPLAVTPHVQIGHCLGWSWPGLKPSEATPCRATMMGQTPPPGGGRTAQARKRHRSRHGEAAQPCSPHSLCHPSREAPPAFHQPPHFLDESVRKSYGI